MKNDLIIKKVGVAIKHQRIAKGLTQKSLATKANISASTLSRAEKGTIELRMETALKICSALNFRFPKFENEDFE